MSLLYHDLIEVSNKKYVLHILIIDDIILTMKDDEENLKASAKMGVMPTMNDHGFWVKSRALELLLKKRYEDKRHIPIDEVAVACKVSLSTANRFLSDDVSSVSQAEIIAAIEIAEYFKVSLYGDDESLLIKVSGKGPEKKERKKGARGRPRKTALPESAVDEGG